MRNSGGLSGGLAGLRLTFAPTWIGDDRVGDSPRTDDSPGRNTYWIGSDPGNNSLL